MKRNIIFAAFLLSGILLGINAQEYYIEGFYERHGDGNYTLKDVHTNGIYLDGNTSLTETMRGEKKRITCDDVEATMVKFSFDKATTDCPTKWSQGFVFQYWDEDNSKWKTDVEACKGQTTSYSEKNMVIMLVLDYSYSMKENISRIQSSAIKFINSVSSVSEGNVHVGIIAFSGMDLAENQVFHIRPLNKDNRYQFENFIRDSKKGKETALYYSMDKAIKMMETYVSLQQFSVQDYNGACMITFTDGLDNASINDKISVSFHRGRKNEYLNYLSGKLSGPSRKTILGLPVENFAIGFTGSEDFTKEDIDFFRDVLQQTTPDANHFKLASRFEEVEAYFETITKNLTDRWETLNMYVGESQHGRIRWVLNCGEAPKPDHIRTNCYPWFGLSVEFGIAGRYQNFFGGMNLEMAFSINSIIAVGGRVGTFLGNNYNYGVPYVDLGILVGPEIKITFPRNNAIILGCGGGILNGDGPLYLRVGYKTRSTWFFTTETMFGGAGIGFGIGAGLSFGGKPRN